MMTTRRPCPRCFTRCIGVLLALVNLASPARAEQDQPGEQPAQGATTPGDAQSPRPAPAPSTVCRSPAEIEAQAYYDRAMRLVVDGKLAEARDLLQQIITRFQGTRYAAPAKQKLAEIDASYRPEAEPAGPDTSGRVELIIGDSVLWLGYGMAAPGLFTEDGEKWSKAFLWTGLGMGVAAGVTSALLTRRVAIPDGYSNMHLFSQTWGSWNALAIYMLAVGLDDDSMSLQGVTGSIIGGGLAGLATSLIFKDWMSIPRGKSEFITASTLWASILGASTVILLAGEDLEFRPTIGTILGAGEAALVASALWAPDWTKSRVRYVNLMGLGGVVLGDAILLAAEVGNPRTYGAVTLGATLAGLAIGVLVTSGMPNDSVASRKTASLPALVSVDSAGRLDWGVPIPRLVPSAHQGNLHAALVVDILAGVH